MGLGYLSVFTLELESYIDRIGLSTAACAVVRTYIANTENYEDITCKCWNDMKP